MTDPYAVVHAEVQRQLADAGTAILKWRQAGKAERPGAGADVLRLLDEVGVDLRDLEEMVEIAASAADSRARATFLRESQRTCSGLRDEVEGRSDVGAASAVAPKGLRDRAELLRSDGASAHAPSAAAPSRRDAPIESVLQQEMLTQRDEVRRMLLHPEVRAAGCPARGADTQRFATSTR